jgi:hypothetical protein
MWGESDLPQYNAMFATSFLIFLNITTLFILIEALMGTKYLVSIPMIEYSAGGILLMLFVVNYFLLVRHGKYLKIAEELRKESQIQKRRGLIFIWLYIIGSFVTNFFFVWLAY